MKMPLLRLIGVIAIVTVLVPSAARAADEIGLSNDGTTWSSALPHPLFDPDFRWVPGDSQTASFYIRNQGPSAALMTIEARSADSDELLGDDDINLRVRADGGAWISLDRGVASASLTEEGIAKDEVVRVDVNATFDPASTNQSQTKQLSLRFAVVLADALAGDDDGADADGSGSDAEGTSDGPDAAGLLPATGSVVGLAVLVAGVALVAVGLLVARRRRAGDDEVCHG